MNLLSNARCLGEGVDVPAIDGIGFIDPRKSTIDIAQAIGRAIRKSDYDKTGTIVVPVLVSEHTEESPEEQLNASRFRSVWNVLNALRAHDEVLAEELDTLRYQLGRRGEVTDRLPGKITIDIPTSVGTEFIRAIETKLVSTSTASWEFWHGLLESFSQRQGHARPVQLHKEGNFRLGEWVNSQRQKVETMSPERKGRLENLAGWTWNLLEFQWEENFASLEKFIEREGHARPHPRHVEDGYNIGSWVTTRRQRKNLLSSEQISRLENLPGWSWDPRGERWPENMADLEKYVKREGSASPPRKHREGGYALAVWISAQRGHREELSPEKVSRLENLPGWTWDALETQWEEGFTALERYVEREGHARPTVGFKENGYDVGRWVSKQRGVKEQLSTEQISRLESLTGWTWNTGEFRWEIGFSHLQRFVEKEGHARPNVKHEEDGHQLGAWVYTLKRRRNNLTPEQTSRLEDLPGWEW